MTNRLLLTTVWITILSPVFAISTSTLSHRTFSPERISNSSILMGTSLVTQLEERQDKIKGRLDAVYMVYPVILPKEIVVAPMEAMIQSHPFSIDKTEWNEKFKERIEKYLADDSQPLDLTLVRELRVHGYESLTWLSEFYKFYPVTHEEYKKQSHSLLLFDKVCGQKDGFYSRLFWHTNFENAKAIAKKENKNIISLCMLGDFTEDLSCANSRFFRIFLYSDNEVSNLLRTNYVLHVQSVIDVPKITIEYPDGTKQIQTITGNSMHLMMNSEGEIIDALPGLYGPAFFQNWLNTIGLRQMESKTNPQWQKNYYSDYSKNLDTLKKITSAISFADTSIAKVSELLPRPISESYLSSMQSVRKSIIEIPILSKLQPSAYLNIAERNEQVKEIELQMLAQLLKLGYEIEDVRNRSVFQPMIPLIMQVKKKQTPEELTEAVEKVIKELTTENIRNEVLYHTRILEWLKDESLRKDMNAFINKSYKELFLTPLDDKKMGMYNPELFYGLTDDGF